MANSTFEEFKRPAEILANDAKQTIELVQHNAKLMSDNLSEKSHQVTSAISDLINQVYGTYKSLWKDYPLLVAFATFQLAFAAIPIAIFGAFCSVLFMETAFIASAVVAFWVIIAGWIMFGTLVVTFFLASIAYIWCLGAYLAYNLFQKTAKNDDVMTDARPLLYGKQLTNTIHNYTPISPKDSIQDSGFDDRSIRTEQTPKCEDVEDHEAKPLFDNGL
ncbi:hypothetical protein NEOLI_000009 [Neolecta irregularis DAH-3]|uniref:Uncharacterized protein n=1 Tax=Neolecta irregularis (strain DAH-3) TaxID=1198029 RepID=A0A1U7LWI0_NEOID|nr:hypothetical protein NEOLI_000009 [Neolecta irregularis DAH-3]|eukprot:OLL26994.1 hypothetical protein NEOLI_000009 [Neolecta irregularis DAH-3]